MQLTPKQLKELKLLNSRPQPVTPLSKFQIQKSLAKLGLAQFTYNNLPTPKPKYNKLHSCSITEKGSQMLNDTNNPKPIAKPTYTFLNYGDIIQTGDERWDNITLSWIPALAGFTSYGSYLIRRLVKE